MKISIITVCKNAVNTIEETLLSIYEQTYTNIEHIVIDGVSTDGTLEILSKYKNNISILISESDTGIYNAMNKAIKFVTGDIVYFLNANDSLYSKDIFEIIIKEFQNYPDLQFLWGDVQFMEDNEEACIATYEDIKTKSDLMYRNPCHQGIFYKSEVFKKYGDYDESLPIYADYEFNARILVAHNSRCKHLPVIFARFELGGASTSTNEKIQLRQKQERKDIYKKIFSNNFYFVLDNFFKRFFGTPSRLIKNSRLWKKAFDICDSILISKFKNRISLNIINE